MSNPQHEPTMEEILASIRKIISEDASEPAPDEAAAPAAIAGFHPEAEPALGGAPAAPGPMELPPEDDVLELTDEMAEEPASPSPVSPVAAPLPMAAPVQAPVDDIVFQHVADEEPGPEFEPEPEPEPDFEPAAESILARPVGRDQGIFSDKSRKAMDNIFAAIAPLEDDDAGSPDPAAFTFDRAASADSVAAVFERAVRSGFDPVLKAWLAANRDDLIEQMKPIIRDWLDENFPSMLEEAVRAEVARVAKPRPPR